MNSLSLNRKGKLLSIIKKRIEEKGGITFAEFMELALYYPHYGYYASSDRRAGRDGDFLTSPELNCFFGKALAMQIIEMWQVMGRPRNLFVIELGGGKGTLAREIVEHIREKEDGLYRAIDYRIVEINPHSSRGMETLRRGFYNDDSWHRRVSWYNSLEDAIIKGNTIILSNEFFDALPCNRVSVKNGELKEVYIGYKKGFYEFLNPLSSERIERYFIDLGIELIEGMEGEVNLRAMDYIREIGRRLMRGFVITIDYGCPSKELYSARHHKGTILCYYKHRIGHDPYKNIGLQDITSHVNFTSLSMEGAKEGLKTTGFTDQGSFLIGLGVLEELASLGDEQVEERMGIKNLFMPGGFGDNFKVLIQHKGLECPPVLKGLSWRNKRDRLFVGMQKNADC